MEAKTFGSVYIECSRCGTEHNEKGKHCYTCKTVLQDEEYLDDGSGIHLNERKDRSRAVLADYNEDEEEEAPLAERVVHQF
jgi:hypothetical protein